MSDLYIGSGSWILGRVNERYGLPFQPRPAQLKRIGQLGPLDTAGYYCDPGTGKTLMSTVSALHKIIETPDLAVLVIMPFPVLLPQWTEWLRNIKGVGKVVQFQGTPKERAAMRLGDAQFIVMSTPIFKKERERILRELKGRPLLGIVDEAHCIKNIGSQTYKAVRDTFQERLMLLTGTPLTTPGDAYAYCRLVSPPIYRSERHFRNLHVGDEDFFGKVTSWVNLDMLRENFLNNSTRMLKEEALADLKQPVYKVIDYAMAPAHAELYERLVEEQLLLLEDGSKIDATSASRLYNAAQQIIANWDHFSGNPNNRAAVFDVVESVLDEVGCVRNDKVNWSDRAQLAGMGEIVRAPKIIIFAQYRMTNRKLVQELAPYGAVACFSEVTPAQQAKNITRFMEDPTCQVLVANPGSAGYGWNPQKVCSDVLFVEAPTVPRDFHQGIGRVYRDGQEFTPVIRICRAAGTIQHRLHHNLLEKDALANSVQTAYQDLKDALRGS